MRRPAITSRERRHPSGAGVLAVYAYDDLGRQVSLTRGNGVVTDYTYDDASRLETLSHDLAGTADDQTLTFARNPLGQITGRTGSNAAYDWDEFVAESTSYSHNGLNQMTAAGATNFSYDERGARRQHYRGSTCLHRVNPFWRFQPFGLTAIMERSNPAFRTRALSSS